jgi:hypothetical protein
VLFGAGFILALLVHPTLAGGKVEDDPLPRRMEEICGRGPQLGWGEESAPALAKKITGRRACVRWAWVF